MRCSNVWSANGFGLISVLWKAWPLELVAQCLDGCSVPFAEAIDFRVTPTLTRDGQVNAQVLRRQTPRHAVGPFHQGHTRSLEIFVCAEIGKLRLTLQSIRIEMIDRQPRLILLNQHKRRAGNGTTVRNTEPLRDGPNHVRLAGAQRTDESYDRAGKKQPA